MLGLSIVRANVHCYERGALSQGRNLKRGEIKSKAREEKLDQIGNPLIPYYKRTTARA
jgi:hypothetical protein